MNKKREEEEERLQIALQSQINKSSILFKEMIK